MTGEIRFDYIKSNFFRVIRVDGVHGGLTAKGDTIQMALFSERPAIPQEQVYHVENGRLGELKSQKGRQAVVRELEVDALLDLDAAKAISNWLREMVAKAESIAQTRKELP